MLTACREYRALVIEMARGALPVEQRRDLMAHVEGCAGCARALDDQFALSEALTGLLEESLPEMAVIETRVLSEFDGAAARSRWKPGRSRARAIALLAAGLAAAAWIRLAVMERRSTVPKPSASVTNTVEAPLTMAVAASAHPAGAVAPARHGVTKVRATAAAARQAPENETFLAIPYTPPLTPEEPTTVVRMEVPVAALIAAGFRVQTPDPGAMVNADVVVSQDGRARAIRLNSREEERQ